MKKMLICVLFVLVNANAGAASLSQYTYAALFFDDSHSSWCAMGSAPFTVELWIWVLPGQSGLGGISFDMSYPPNVEFVESANNPAIPLRSVKCHPPCPYFSFPPVTCLTERTWTWLYHETLLVTSSDPATIAMLPFPPESPSIIAWNCEDVDEPAIQYSNLYLNHAPTSPACAGVAAGTATWGAIKALYR